MSLEQHHFDWDISNIRHLARHGVAPHEAEEVIMGEPVDLELQYSDTHMEEERYLQLGSTAKGRILQVLSTWRNEKIRVITAWDAPKALKLGYLEETR